MKKNKLVFSILISLATLTTITITAKAYNLTGKKWATNNLYYYYGGSNSESSKAYRSAADLWSLYTDINFSASLNSFNVNCTDSYNSDVDWDGNSTWTYYLSNNITCKATIILNSAMPAWNDQKALKSIAVHELGHVLGLDHSDGLCIMNPYTYGEGSRYETYNLSTPQQDDIDGINYLY